MMTTNSMTTIWKVWLRNPDGETAIIEIENANTALDAKIKGVDEYDRPGWYAVDAALIGSKKCTG